MQEVDFSFTGGLPFSQNILEQLQDGYKEALAAICLTGYSGDPVILTGCNDAGSGVYNDGWIFDGTEVQYFAGGDSVAAGTTVIKLKTTTTTLVFESGASEAVYVSKQYEFDATGSDDITDLELFHKVFAEKNSGVDAFVQVNVSGGTGNLSGQINFFKLLATPFVSIRGGIVVQSPSALADPPAYQTVGTVAADFRPASNFHFKANIEGYLLDNAGAQYFNDVNGRITAAGNIDLQLIKPDAGVTTYTIFFNTVIPLV